MADGRRKPAKRSCLERKLGPVDLHVMRLRGGREKQPGLARLVSTQTSESRRKCVLICHRKPLRLWSRKSALSVSSILRARAHSFRCRLLFSVSIYMTYLFRITYLIFAIFPDVWTGVDGESQGIGGLNYLSIASGSFAGLFLELKAIDCIYKTWEASKSRTTVLAGPSPMSCMSAGSVINTFGLFWYGWSIGRTHWVMPNIGALKYTAGTISCLQGMQTYIIDSYPTYAASVFAAAAILRSLAGFDLSLFAPYLYHELSYCWGISVLALICIVIDWTAPLIFWFFGPKLRAASRFAAS